MEFTGKQMEDVTNKVDTRLNKVRLLEKENSVPRDWCNKLDAYERRWNLRVAGINEQAGENVILESNLRKLP